MESVNAFSTNSWRKCVDYDKDKEVLVNLCDILSSLKRVSNVERQFVKFVDSFKVNMENSLLSSEAFYNIGQCKVGRQFYNVKRQILKLEDSL